MPYNYPVTSWRHWVWRYTIATVSLAFLIAVLAVLPGLNQTAVALGLVLLVILVAVTVGRGPALYVSILAGLSFNYFFIGPFYSFRISRPEDIVAFFVFVMTAVVVGQLSSRLERRSLQAEELRKSEQLKTALLGSVTHDLRTPLTSIKAAVTTIRSEHVSTEVQQELYEVIEQEADRLNHFIQGMVDLAKLEAGRSSLESRTVAADEIIEDALRRAAPLVNEHDVVVSVEPDLPPLRVDPRLISQVLFALIENAAKYSEPGTKIVVSAQGSASHGVRFAVCDEGPGIAPELRTEVFQKFFRAGAKSGLGLGLAIAHDIVRAHGGRIWIEPGPQGCGSSVRFQIPAGEMR